MSTAARGLTTGELGAAAGLSHKAVRLYTARGLLTASREEGNGRRCYDPLQVPRARSIALLRGLGLSLVDVATVLDGDDCVAAFDAHWSGHRSEAQRLLGAGEYVRSVLAGRPSLDVDVQIRTAPERLTLTREAHARLQDLAQVIPATTQLLFGEVADAGNELAGAPFVQYHERATEQFAARISLGVPIARLQRPAPGTRLQTEPERLEAFVSLDQAHADSQPFVVAVHDYLSTSTFSPRYQRVGDNREIFLPTWASGTGGPVMEISAPVTPTTGG
jgi:DNA-binding transcriptional MerR regulator